MNDIKRGCAFRRKNHGSGFQKDIQSTVKSEFLSYIIRNLHRLHFLKKRTTLVCRRFHDQLFSKTANMHSDDVIDDGNHPGLGDMRDGIKDGL